MTGKQQTICIELDRIRQDVEDGVYGSGDDLKIELLQNTLMDVTTELLD